MRGTTLIGPIVWTVIACWGVAGAEFYLAFAGGRQEASSIAASLRYASALLVFCPPLAAMGAKRPQHHPWQFVVLSLWGVLSLPAWEVLLIRPHQALDVEGLRAWFLPALILLGLANQLGTRFWPSALLAVSAQFAILTPYFPLLRYDVGVWGSATALLLVDLAVLLVLLGVPRRRVDPKPLDRVWLDFRDAFGAVWALRLAERFNAASRCFEWNVNLEWDGFTIPGGGSPDEQLPAEVETVLRQNLKNLLRRFVSNEWIQRRWEIPPPSTGGVQRDCD